MVSTSLMVDTSSHPRAQLHRCVDAQLHRCVERSAYDSLAVCATTMGPSAESLMASKITKSTIFINILLQQISYSSLRKFVTGLPFGIVQHLPSQMRLTGSGSEPLIHVRSSFSLTGLSHKLHGERLEGGPSACLRRWVASVVSQYSSVCNVGDEITDYAPAFTQTREHDHVEAASF